jgi:tetratricopeptide (TPR) repeat protein
MDALLMSLDRDPAQKRRRWLTAAVAIALAIAAVAGVVRARTPSLVCKGAAQKLVGVWDPERRRAVHDALLATKKSFAEGSFLAAARELDKYVSAWTAAHTDACVATRVRGEQSEEVMELRIECLDRRREEVRALVDVLAHADAQLAQRAPQAVESLPGLDECKNADALRQVVPPPATPQVHQRVAELRTRLSEATARRNAGQYAQALKLAESVVGDARQLSYAPILAEALTLRGVLEGDTRHKGTGVTTLLDASVAAEAGRYDHALAEALAELVFALSSQARFAEAHDCVRLGRAALARAGGDSQLEMRLDQCEAFVLSDEGRYDEALALQNRVLPRLEQLLGASSLLGRHLVNTGNTYRRNGDPDQAISFYKRALAIYEKAYPGGHPGTAQILLNIGASLSDKYDNQGALDADERALTILQAVHGPDHPDTAMALGNMGTDFTKLGHPGRALPLIERALEIKMRTLGPDDPSLGVSECQMAEVLLKLRRSDAALSHAGHCLDIRERLLGADHPKTAEALMIVGQCRLARGDVSTALQQLERAVANLEHHRSDLDNLPNARFALAQALWKAERDRPRARSLAQAARIGSYWRAEVDAWLAKHR